ncbi:MAG: DUF1552 domain-containing protein [Myxococcota bacterium]
MSIRPRSTRRSFLTGAGAGALSLPLLSSYFSRSVEAAQDGAYAKRLIVFFTPNEPIHRDHWMPDGQGDSFALTTLAPMMASLQDHAQDIVMIGDLEMKTRDIETHGAGHVGIGHMLTGRTVTPYGSANAEFWASGISVDQYVADACGVDALTLGARPGGANGNSRISYRGDSQPVHPRTRPDETFDALFADFELPASELAAQRARRLSILDRVSGDINGLSSQLPKEAAEKLDVHLSLVRDLEDKLANETHIECEPGVGPGPMDYESNAAFPVAGRRQIDVMVQALACGITDVASLQLSNTGSGDVTPMWPDEGLNINIDSHTIAHDYKNGAAELQRRIDLERFYFEQFAYLLDRLAEIPEGDGRLLDNTLVLWTKNLGTGHNSRQMLHMLCGGAGGALETGRYVSFPGVAHNDLLTSVCNLMGLDDTSFGDPELSTGALDL